MSNGVWNRVTALGFSLVNNPFTSHPYLKVSINKHIVEIAGSSAVRYTYNVDGVNLHKDEFEKWLVEQETLAATVEQGDTDSGIKLNI